MHFTRNKRIINFYFGHHSTYSNYDINTVLIMDFMYEKKITAPSDVIERLRITHTPIMHIGKNDSTHYMHLLLSAETRDNFVKSQRLWITDYYKGGVVPRSDAVRLRKKRSFYRNAILFARRRPSFNPKRLNKKTIWLQKHKLI